MSFFLHRVELRMTRIEKAHCLLAAQRANLSLAAWIRHQCGLDGVDDHRILPPRPFRRKGLPRYTPNPSME